VSLTDSVEDNTARVRAYCGQQNRQSVTMPDKVRYGKMVGMESSTHIRSCESQGFYRKHLCVGDSARFILVILEGDGDGKYTESIQVIKDVTEACRVG
jgi:hypothetical protein